VISARGQEPTTPDQPTTATKDVIVIVRGDRKLDTEIVKLACSVARPKQSRILALYGIEVPRSQKVDDSPPPQDEAKATAALQFASTIAERCDYELDSEMVQTRSFAHSIVEEANQQGCVLLILGVPYKEKHATADAMDATVDYVLEHATCRVWLIRGSKESPC